MAAVIRRLRARLAPRAADARPMVARRPAPGLGVANLSWRLRREAATLGWRGMAGLALLGAAAILWLGAQRPDERKAQQLKADVADLRARLRSAGEAGSGPDGRALAPATRADQLATFYAFFPVVASLPDWLAVLNTAAASNGLVLESGEYALVAPRGEQRLARYEITLPVKGTWPQLRGFVADVMEKIPAAALEDLVLRREAVGAADVEAKLKLVLWLGAHDAAPVPAAVGARELAR